MKRLLLLLLCTLCIRPAAADTDTDAGPRKRPGLRADSIAGPEEGLNPRRRFLPMRQRIDRKTEGHSFVYKGEVMLGLTASYGTLTSDETELMLVFDEIDADGSMFTVNPFIGYFYRDNRCLGIRAGYRRIDGTLGNVTFDLGEKNDISMSFGDVDLMSSNLTFGLFHRSYVGLDPNGRFGLFGEIELSLGTGNSTFAYRSGDEIKTTRSENFSAKLSFNPGAAVYIFPNVCGTLSFGLGGVQYGSVRQKDADGNHIGSRTTSKMRFKLNIADIRIGVVVHFWNKKKQ